MKNFKIFIIAFFIAVGNLFAQTPDLLWSKIYDITEDIDEGKSVRQTLDGGYIITGSCVPDGMVSYIDVLLLKTDASGNIVWTKTFDRNFFEEGLSVEQTADGGFIIGGRCTSGSYPFIEPPISDAWVIKTDINGDTLWIKTYGGTGNDYCTSIQPTSDSGYIMTGTMNAEYCYPKYEINEEYKPDSATVWLIKTDANGNTRWTKTCLERSYGNCVEQTVDGGYIIVGWIFPDEQEHQSDVLLIKTDSSGDTLWTKIIGGNECEAGFCVRQTAEGYVIAGQTKAPGKPYNALVIKTDLSGEVVWRKTFGGELSDVVFSVEVSAEGYFFTGATNGTWWVTAMADMWMFETDIAGNLRWERIEDIRFGDIAYSGIQSDVGEYVVNGMTSGGFGGDLWLAKLGSEPTGINLNEKQAPFFDYILYQNSPNPFNAETTIFFELAQSKQISLKVYDLLGNAVQAVFENVHFQAGLHSVHLDASQFASGVYFFRLEADEGYTQTKKMCVLK